MSKNIKKLRTYCTHHIRLYSFVFDQFCFSSSGFCIQKNLSILLVRPSGYALLNFSVLGLKLKIGSFNPIHFGSLKHGSFRYSQLAKISGSSLNFSHLCFYNLTHVHFIQEYFLLEMVDCWNHQNPHYGYYNFSYCLSWWIENSLQITHNKCCFGTELH